LTERRADELRLEVARVAMRIFTEEDSPSATVERIAAEAGISPRTFHRHFPAKEDVLVPLFRHTAELGVAVLRAAPADADPLSVLVDAELSYPRQLTEADQRFMRLVSRTPELRRRWLELDDDMCEAVTDFLVTHVGMPRDPDLPQLTARLVAQAARYVIELWILGGPREEMDRLMRAAISTALAGVLPRESATLFRAT
jgi:AcrR family transcriptional regulator